MFHDKKNREVILLCVRQLSLLAILLVSSGCVERKLWVRTDPKGAKVSVNGEPIGKAPASWSFHHYGTVLVDVQLEGYQPMQKKVKLKSPWYQKPVVEFFADVIVPAKIEDNHELELKLEPLRKLTPEEVDAEIAKVTAGAKKARADVEKSGEKRKSPE